MFLLRELNENVQYVIEEDKGVKNLILSGTFMQSAVPNRNKRIYPTEILQKESERYNKENILTNRAWGELGHPNSPTVNLERVCIRIKELKQEGNDFMGKALVTNTPMGNVVRGLIEAGGSLGVSSRALGSLKPLKDSLSEVQDDLNLRAIDVVSDPSAPNAYVDSVMEGREWVFNERTGEYAEVVRKELKRMPTKLIEENSAEMFKQFLFNLTFKS